MMRMNENRKITVLWTRNYKEGIKTYDRKKNENRKNVKILFYKWRFFQLKYIENK